MTENHPTEALPGESAIDRSEGDSSRDLRNAVRPEWQGV